MLERKVDPVMIVDGWGCLTTPLLIQKALILEASSVASDQDRFDAAYEAFRDLSEGLYDIDTRQCAREATSDDAPDVKLSDGQAKLRELVHLPRIGSADNSALGGLASKLTGLSERSP